MKNHDEKKQENGHRESVLEKIFVWVIGYGMIAGGWCCSNILVLSDISSSRRHQGRVVNEPLFYVGMVMSCVSVGLGLFVSRWIKKNKPHGRPLLAGISVILFFFLGGVMLTGAAHTFNNNKKTVVVYSALDRAFSEPILKRFERETGIHVKVIYDSESSKTTGLVNRLIARRNNPECDVFWNNEVVQTVRLGQMGLLANYTSEQARRFPERYRDPDGKWTGFAARARLIIYNTDIVEKDGIPQGLSDFTNKRWKGQSAVASPFFGTTLSHFAILYQIWGGEKLADFCRDLRANDISFCPGNAPVRNMVRDGERAFGLTDTDDAIAAIRSGKPVAVIIPDAQSTGAILIPNSVALILDSPNPNEGKKLIDFLLSQAVERELSAGASAQIPLAKDLADLKTPWDDILKKSKIAEINFEKTASQMDKVVKLLLAEGMSQ